MVNGPISDDPTLTPDAVPAGALFPAVVDNGDGTFTNVTLPASEVLGASSIAARVTTLEAAADDPAQKKVNTQNVAAAVTLDMALYDIHDLTLTDDLDLDLLGSPTAPGRSVQIVLHQGGAGGFDVTWPWQVGWPDDTPPDLSTDAAGELSIVQLFTLDNGATWFGSVLSRGVVPGTEPGTSPVAWHPTMLGGFARQIYDASGVAGSTIATDGNGITSVTDLSGNGRTLTPLVSVTGQPDLLTNALGTLSAIDFNGTSDILVNAAAGAEVSATGTTNKNRTLVALVKPDVVTAGLTQHIAGYFNSADDDSRLRMHFFGPAFGANRNPDNNSGGNSTALASGVTAGQWQLVALTQSSSLVHRLNGVASAPVTPSGTVTLDRFAMGGKADIVPDGWLDGKVIFCVASDIELPLADIQRIEGWMIHKALTDGGVDLRSLLPVGHPYKTTGPTNAPETGLVWESDYEVATDLNQPWDATSVLQLWMGADRPNNPGAAGTLQTSRVLVTEGVSLPGPSNAWKPADRGVRIQLAPYWTDPNQTTGTGTGDVTTTSTGPSNRTELYGRRPTGSLSGTPAEKWPDPAGSERWYGLSVLFPSDFPLDVAVDSNYWFDFVQWKGLNGGSPPFALEVADGNKIRVGGTNFFHLPNNGNVANVTPGEWMRIVVGFRWTHHADGWVEGWVNGVRVLARQTLQTMDTFVTKPDPVYPKNGVYRAGRWDRFETLYFSAMRIGKDRASVMAVA